MQGKPLKDNVRLKIHGSGFTAMENVDTKQDQIEKATVLEVGDECSLVKEGDVVLFKDYNLDTILVDDEVYTIVPESDIKYIFNARP